MTTTPHPYANILHAIADGKQIQISYAGVWVDRTADEWMEMLITESPMLGARVKPHTITINGHEVPEPLREMPPDHTTVYWPGFGPDAGDDMTECCDVGTYQSVLDKLLSEGLLHESNEAASAHAQAIISLTASRP